MRNSAVRSSKKRNPSIPPLIRPDGTPKMGKLSHGNLKKLLKCIKSDPTVVIPPLTGFDSGVHLVGDKYLVISTDPCVGVPEQWFGWLLLNYAASDVALFGAHPRYCTLNLLGSPETTPATFLRVMSQACQASEEIGMTIVTGHTGSYQHLPKIMGVCTAYGIMNRNQLITPAGAKPGDILTCVKPIGLELAVNFVLTQKRIAEEIFGTRKVHELKGLIKMQSCVKEALLLAKTHSVHALHDATEGGLTAAINEMADASQVGFTVEFERIPFAKEAEAIRDYFRLSDIQMLSMSSTGTVLAAVSSGSLGSVERALRSNGIHPVAIGVFSEDRKRRILKDGKKRVFPKGGHDPYERILSGQL
jgi:hydrogenase expression/formation protein HypE